MPIVEEAMRRNIPLTNDSQIFMEVVPCKTIGITGSAGKTTTTTLVGNMAKISHGEKARVGGNIGDPLLNYVDDMQADNVAVLELSSFQLDQMTISPNIAAIWIVTAQWKSTPRRNVAFWNFNRRTILPSLGATTKAPGTCVTK
jgi:UDP-N-acetylmuramoylalanine--D-glutamate ligase